MGILYKITSPSGKSYIGITSTSIEARWKSHRQMRNVETTPLKCAIKKYGHKAFVIQVIAEIDEWDDLCNAEIEAIKSHGTRVPFGYNVTEGGEGRLGVSHSEASKKKMRENHVANKNPEIHRAHARLGAKTYWDGPHGQQRLKAAAEKKAKKAADWKPKSEVMKAALQNPETRKRMSDSAKKRNRDDPVLRRKLSESAKLAWARIKALKEE